MRRITVLVTVFFSITTSCTNQERIAYWQEHGVIFTCPEFVYLDDDISIGTETTIGAGVHILNGSHIGAHCTIGPFTLIDGSVIHDNVTIKSHCVIEQSTCASHTEIGPFAHIHRQSILDEYACIGNFVEISKSTIGAHSKAKHLAYLGMTTLGAYVNWGAGAISCNYDGKKKHETIVENNVFIGSNATLIAPITIGHHAVVAGGSTINKCPVPPYSLAIGRAWEYIKAGYYEPK